MADWNSGYIHNVLCVYGLNTGLLYCMPLADTLVVLSRGSFLQKKIVSTEESLSCSQHHRFTPIYPMIKLTLYTGEEVASLWVYKCDYISEDVYFRQKLDQWVCLD